MKKYTTLALLAILASGSAMATYGPSYDPIAKINQVNTGRVEALMNKETVNGYKNIDKASAAGNTAVVKSGHLKANQNNTGIVLGTEFGNTLSGENTLVANSAGNAITMGSKDDKPKANITQKNTPLVVRADITANKVNGKNNLESGAAGNNVMLTSGNLKSTQSNSGTLITSFLDFNDVSGANKLSNDSYGNQIVMGAKNKDPKAKITQNNSSSVQVLTQENKLHGHNTMDTVGAGNTVTQTSGKLKANQENTRFITLHTENNILTGANVVANYGAGNAITMGQ